MRDRLEDLPPHLRRACEESARRRGIELRTDAAAAPPARAPAALERPRPTVEASRPLDVRSACLARVARGHAKAVEPERACDPNLTEARWGLELYARQDAREIEWLGFHVLTLRLSDGVRLTLDWFARTRDGRFLGWDVKGHMRDDARVKLHQAAEQFEWLEVWVVQWKKQQWIQRRIHRAGHIRRVDPK